MVNGNQAFIWSDGWWIEKDRAWFVDGISNTLFSVDLDTGECNEVSCIPNLDQYITYRFTPFCVKYAKDIFCIPGFGKNIWVYNMEDESFTEIDTDKPKHLQWGAQFWVWNDTLFIAAAGWNKIIEVSISQKIITNYYMICENDFIKGSVLTGGNIYAVSSRFSKVYQFNLTTKKVNTYLLSDMEKRLTTICFDGEKFWLSGYQKELYIWDKEKDSFITINNFPGCSEIDTIVKNKDKENNLPVFNRSVFVGGYIWFIPIGLNKIIYADKKNNVLSVFEIYAENETKDDVLWGEEQGIGNYLLEYVKDDRYMGLFSARNSRILEIDTKELKYQWKEYYFGDNYLQQYCADCNGIYQEGGNPLHTQAYCRGIGAIEYKANNTDNSIGMRIYTKLAGEGME